MQKHHRGERRFQRHRLIKKRAQEEWIHTWDKEHITQEEILNRARRRVVTNKNCACWMCQSQRRFYHNGFAARTLQEIRLMARANDE